LAADEAENRITVTVGEDYEGPCTADLAPYTSLISLDDEFDASAPVELVIKQAGSEDLALNL